MAWGWTALAASIAFEVAGTLLLRMSEGFTRLVPAAFAMLACRVCFAFAGVAMLACRVCFAFAGVAMRYIPLAVVHAIRAGVGIALVAIIAVVWLGESMSALKVAFLAMILVGAVGLHLVSEPC